jgi:hypothetical protein
MTDSFNIDTLTIIKECIDDNTYHELNLNTTLSFNDK